MANGLSHGNCSLHFNDTQYLLVSYFFFQSFNETFLTIFAQKQAEQFEFFNGRL